MTGLIRLGILRPRRQSGERPAPWWADLQQACRQRGIDVSYFTMPDLGRKTLLGQRWNGIGWVMTRQPLPDAVYHRDPGPGGLRATELLLAAGTRFLNTPTVVDKWAAHTLLQGDPAIEGHLPVTFRPETWNLTSLLLDTYSNLYVKPLTGSLGRGICRLERLPRGQCRIRFPDGDDLVLLRAELPAWLQQHLGEPKRHLVQQGLSLNYRGGSADLRLLLHKDGAGIWQISLAAARLGAPGSITANLHTGGQAVPARSFLSRYLGRPAGDEALKKARKLSLAVAERLDQTVGEMGELGLDIGVDGEGQVWYVEYNARPGHEAFQQLRDFAAQRRAAGYVADNVCRLSRPTEQTRAAMY